MAKAPDLTTATACSSAVTGVGATEAAGSHPWNGKIAAFDTKSEKAKDIDQQCNIHMIADGRKMQIAAKNKSNIIAE